MLNPIPVGNISISTNPILENIFGFCYAKVSCPKDLYLPSLPYKKDGKLYFPSGNFEGWYFSEELKYAKSLGYKIEIIKYAFGVKMK